MKASLNRYLRQALDAGITPALSRSLTRRIRTTNSFSIILGLATLPYAFFFYLMGAGWASLSIFFVGLGYFHTLHITAKRSYFAARIYLLVLVNLAICGYSLLFGLDSGVYLLFLPVSTLPLMIFERRNTGALLFGFALSILLFFGSNFLQRQQLFGIPWLPLPDAHYPVVLTIFSIGAFLVFTLQDSNDCSEQLLIEQKAQMVATAKFLALGEMAAGIAHEVNNPLAIIAGRTLTLRRLIATDPDDRARLAEFAQDIEDSAYRIVKIVRGLQSFSRSGDNDPFIPVSLRSIIDDILTFSAARFANSGIELITTVENPEQTLECRPVQISQVLLNIMNNAYDSVKDSPVKWVELRTKKVGPMLEISVTDSGPGIPVEIRERIFEPFFTSKPVGEGTGLGLSIARGLVESHHGTIVLDETYKNTRILIRLPLSQSNS